MASIIRIKRSLGTSKPSSLQWGEYGYVTGIGSYGGTNQYKDRIFLGDDGNNVNPIGGYYYTSMMEHTPGSIQGVENTRNSDKGVVAVLAPATNTGLSGVESLKVDQWNVDNIRIDGNIISSTDTDGDIDLVPNGSGEVHIPDDTFLSFGNDKDAKIEYDEDGLNQLSFTGADIRINVATESNSKDTGALIVEGGVGIEKNLNIGGQLDVEGSLNLEGAAIIDSIKIQDNIISSLSGSSNILYLDPHPDGLSSEGTVIIKGSLQVDGTTTSVNSTTSTLNNPIFHIGDLTTKKTVMTTVVSGVSTIRLDSIVGINTGDIVSGNAGLNVGAANTVLSYDTTNKIVTLTDATISGIATTTELTITHAYDTDTDRGISFAYNDGIGSGTSGNKTGFFGYIDQGNVGSAATNRSWTYIPDATVSNSLVSGTRGYLDIKGIYYQNGDFNHNGLVYFDVDGLQTSTGSPSSPLNASKQIMTAVTKRILNLPSNVTLTKGDIVKQDTSDAYGVVESNVNNSTEIPLIGVEGTFNTSNNLRMEGSNGSISNLSLSPDSVGVIYTDRPQWTDSFDGGIF
jgi:hypothetical protein|tara:strand:+ start:26325 stop:28034 length:1710 start_codon:yes stop_codon:yes gene_type:complete